MFGDDFMLALCIWREARGEGPAGMQAVACVIRNRVRARGSSYYAEVTRAWQFSSITAKGDPELGVYPVPNDPQWASIQALVPGIIDGSLADNTGGAQFYYADGIPLPSWAQGMTATVSVGRQHFYKAAA